MSPRKPRALVLEWNLPFHLELASHLADRHGWQFVYWVGDEANLGNAVVKRFPGIIFHDTVDARYGRPPQALEYLEPHTLSDELLRATAYEQSIALDMMDRIELAGSFSYHDRVRHFQHLAGWWSAVLDLVKPDVMVNLTAPHVIYDYIAYVLCRRRGVRTAIFENATVRGILLPTPIFEHGFVEVVDTYHQLLVEGQEVELSPHFEAYLNEARGTYVPPHELALYAQIYARPARSGTRIPWYLLSKAAKIVNVQRYPAYWRALKGEVSRAFPSRSPKPERQVAGHLHGQFIKAGEASDGAAIELQAWIDKRKVELQAEYNRLATPPDFSKPYVYVPLHVQPERSTSPNGGIYTHADLLVRAVAQSVPAGWEVYVKEHPSQFKPWHVGERGRRVSDYAAMSAPNVRLVPLETKPFDLIDHARAVATITGTSGWEAVARGIPVLCFGIVWYQGCDGVYDARRLEDLQAAVGEIERGAKPNLNKVRTFLKAVELNGIRGYLDIDTQAAAGISEAENIIALSNGIVAMTQQQGGRA